VTATGTGGERWRAPSWRGKNASPAADRWHTFTFPAFGDGLAIWRPLFIHFAERATSRDAPSSPPMPVARPCMRAGSAAPAQTPRHRVAGKRVERGFRGEFRRRVLVATKHLRRFEPRDGCRHEVATTRRVSTRFERKPISGVQRRRRPDRQACVACATRRADRDLATSYREGARRGWCSRTTP